MTIESLPPGRHNHFNLLRLLAACAVIIAHCYGDGADPFSRLTGFELGETAVLGFFAISGYFIFESFERRRSNGSFVMARVLRILPALLVVALISALVVGPIFSELPPNRYFREPSVWLYPLKTVSIYRVMAANLPAVFMHNPKAGDINISLWTLYFEVACYAGLFLAGLAGLLGKRRFPLLIIAYVPAYVVARYGPWAQLRYLAIFSLPFVTGMLLFRYRHAALPKAWLAVSAAAAAIASALFGHPIGELWAVGVACGILWLGFAHAPAFLPFNRLGDFSYGTYIYGFPVQQIVWALVPGIAIWPLIGLTMSAALLCGALSWHVVERPALRVRRSADVKGDS